MVIKQIRWPTDEGHWPPFRLRLPMTECHLRQRLQVFPGAWRLQWPVARSLSLFLVSPFLPQGFADGRCLNLSGEILHVDTILGNIEPPRPQRTLTMQGAINNNLETRIAYLEDLLASLNLMPPRPARTSWATSTAHNAPEQREPETEIEPSMSNEAEDPVPWVSLHMSVRAAFVSPKNSSCFVFVGFPALSNFWIC